MFKCCDGLIVCQLEKLTITPRLSNNQNEFTGFLIYQMIAGGLFVGARDTLISTQAI